MSSVYSTVGSSVLCIVIVNVVSLGVLFGIGFGLGVGFQAVSYQLYNGYCIRDADCFVMSEYGYFCMDSRCKCSNVSYYYNYKCLAKGSYGASCYTDGCQENAGLDCFNSICSCKDYKRWNVSTCVYGTYAQSCSSTEICDTAAGLNCTSSLCNCASTHYFNTNTKSCAMKKSYGVACSKASECQSTVGLTSCVTNCDCASKFQWNGTFCVCVTKLVNATTALYGSTGAGSTSFSVEVSSLSNMVVYSSSSSIHAIVFNTQSGSTLTYGSTSNAAITTTTAPMLVNKKITAMIIRSSATINSIQLQLYDTNTKATTTTAQMGGGSGGTLTYVNQTTLAATASFFEVTRLAGSADSSNLRTLSVDYSSTQCS